MPVTLTKRCAIAGDRTGNCAGVAVTRNNFGRYSEAFCANHAEIGDVVLTTGAILTLGVSHKV